jgi:hypothetical protein
VLETEEVSPSVRRLRLGSREVADTYWVEVGAAKGAGANRAAGEITFGISIRAGRATAGVSVVDELEKEKENGEAENGGKSHQSGCGEYGN